MKAILKSKAEIGNNYNRFGKNLPKEEKEIDVAAFFKVDSEREKYIITKLKNDKNIDFKLIGKQDEMKQEDIQENIKEEISEPAKRGRPKING